MEGIDPHASDRDVVDQYARLFGLLHRLGNVAPGIAPLVALVGGKTVAKGEQNPPFSGNLKQTPSEMAYGCSKARIASSREASSARQYGHRFVEVFQYSDLHTMSRVAREREDCVGFAGSRQPARQRIRAREL